MNINIRALTYTSQPAWIKARRVDTGEYDG